MLPRRLQPQLAALLQQFPAVALLGPRQVGKTALARALAGSLRKKHVVYLNLELPSDQAKLAEPELYLTGRQDRLVILDEIHRLPALFPMLRRLMDQSPGEGQRRRRFLLLGATSMDLLPQASESLAGRITFLKLSPFSLAEVAARMPADAANRLWARGGFPGSFLARSDAASFAWRTAFIQTYLERYAPALGPRLPADTLGRFWQMLAHNQGQVLNAAKLASALGVSGHTVARYLDLMVGLLLVRRLQPWAGNGKKRLVRTPKVYVRDSGLLHALLNLRHQDELLGHPVAGASWEGLLIENILDALPDGAQARFYRTSAGAEIDLVVEFGQPRPGGGARWAIEIKRSLVNPAPSKGFLLACEDIQATRRVVLYPGAASFPLSSSVEAMPLQSLLRDPLLRG